MKRANPCRYSGGFRPVLAVIPMALGGTVVGCGGVDGADPHVDTADSAHADNGNITHDTASEAVEDAAPTDAVMVMPELPTHDTSSADAPPLDPEIAPPLLFPASDRPVPVRYPDDFTSNSNPRPLVVLLHGFGASGAIQDAYLGLSAVATQRGWLALIPDGTTNRAGNRFWNAAPSWCCDFDNSGVDDTTWLASVVAEAMARLPVDPDRIYLVGHSNGGYMAHRMACAHAELFAGIASIAGGLPARVNACAPTRGVALLQVHGTFDSVVYFQGQFGLYPSARDVGDRWSSYNRCGTGSPSEASTRRDFDEAVFGAETRVLSWPGCPDEAGVELWQMDGSQHVPMFAPAFVPALLDRLESLSGQTRPD